MRREIQSVPEKQIKCCYGNLWEHFFPAQQTIKFISCNQLSKSDTLKKRMSHFKIGPGKPTAKPSKIALTFKQSQMMEFPKNGGY